MSAHGDKCIVVDTNVLAVAEGLNDEATDHCRQACVRIAQQVRGGQLIAVDADDLIVREYIRVLKKADTSGVGTKLAQTLFRQRHDPQVCRRVQVTPADEPPGSFEEVPAKLRDFDIDDHVFIAVAAADGRGTQVLQALDEEWWDRKQDFADSGIDVQFLCIADLMDTAQQ